MTESNVIEDGEGNAQGLNKNKTKSKAKKDKKGKEAKNKAPVQELTEYDKLVIDFAKKTQGLGDVKLPL